MQELIEWVDNVIALLPDESVGTKNQMLITKAKAESILEKEKEQMCDFFREGYMWCNSPSLRVENGEIVTSTMRYGAFYYDKKFKKQQDETK